jgi:hypothetical protein
MKINITLLNNVKIKWEGMTDFSELYKYMKLHLVDIGYADEKNLEKKYIERIKEGGKKQIEIEWKSIKKKSEFFTFHIDTTFLILGMSDAEVQLENGSKRKMNKGVFEVRITSYLKSTSKWDELKGLQRLYYEMVIRKRINEYLSEIYDKSTAYHSFIKNFLGLRD